MKVRVSPKKSSPGKGHDLERILGNEEDTGPSADTEISRYPRAQILSCLAVFSLAFLATACIFLRWPQLNDDQAVQQCSHCDDIDTLVIIEEEDVFRLEAAPADAFCPSDLADELKFDCWPQPGASEEGCVSRGCCWSLDAEEPNAPACFYPQNYALYSFVNVSRLDGGPYNGVVAYLKQVGDSTYPDDVALLKLVATFESRTRLRVQIVDALHERFHVDVLGAPPPPPPASQRPVDVNDTDYQFVIDTGLTGFSVVRRASQEVLFSTAGVGGFIYADQLLQLSGALASGSIYGLGEHQDSLRHSMDWQRLTLFAHDEVPRRGRNLYGAHPFYLMMENDGRSHGVFLKNTDPMEIVLQPAPAITYRVLGGVLDFYFFLGPDPVQVIEQYTEVIGRPAMPPYWGLGFHLCRYNYGSLNRTREIWARTRQAKIPFDVQWNDIDYMDRNDDFTYDHRSFAGLPEFVDEVHAVGMHYVPIIDPGISQSEVGYGPYDQGLDMKVFVRQSADSDAPFVGKVWNTVSTVWPDFTHPNATEYWTQQLRLFHNQVPFDGAWIDMNEPSNFYSGTVDGCPADSQWDHPPYTPHVSGGQLFYRTLCMSAAQHLGRHYDLHNVYGLTEAVATDFALRDIRGGRRPFIISRSTAPGQGRFGGHWSGDVMSDWTNMRLSINSVLNFNMYGVPLVGADICGFTGNTTAALCQRWMQLGAFYPFSRNHNTDDAVDQDPVALGPAVVEASVKALNVRYSVLPYLYTLFWNAHRSGAPVARPLFFEFPADRQTHTVDEQFLWGQALLVAPVLTEDTHHVELYVPRARWYDFYSRRLVSAYGGQWLRLAAPLDTIPLLVRGGHVLPMQQPAQTTTESRLNPFHLLVALDETFQARGELYWDAGDDDGGDDDAGRYDLVGFEASGKTLRSQVLHWNYLGRQALRLERVAVLGVGASQPVVSVRVNGRPHDAFAFDAEARLLTVTRLEASLGQPMVIDYE